MTVDDVLTSSGQHPERVTDWPPTASMLNDALLLASRCSQLLLSYMGATEIESEPLVNSGYRPPDVNAATLGAAKHSNHMVCRAVDLADPDGVLTKWCQENLDLLAHFELYMEDPRWTRGWVHLQSVAPASAHRVFIPMKGPPPA